MGGSNLIFVPWERQSFLGWCEARGVAVP
jgi:hypothetical protein